MSLLKHFKFKDASLLSFMLLGAAPAILFVITWLLSSDKSIYFKLLFCILFLMWNLYFIHKIIHRTNFHIKTLNSLLDAIYEGDFSLRATESERRDDLGKLYTKVNDLADHLQKSRVIEQELTSLLGKILDEINVSIFVFDGQGKIKMLNPQSCKLLTASKEQLIGLQIDETPLSFLQTHSGDELIDHNFPGASGRWQITWQDYREQGKPGKILYITDLKQILGEEELKSWKSLIRVVAHEVNNSLTPISSICQTLQGTITNGQNSSSEDLLPALEVIGERASTLQQFISGYANIARLPEPNKQAFNLDKLLEKVVNFFHDKQVHCEYSDNNTELHGDPVHLEQVLINLVKNGLEASDDAQESRVEISYSNSQEFCEIYIKDQGNGISNPENLFVPFYTTKEKGTGIGLLLCRQIVTSHKGTITLSNREDQQGAVATLRLPKTNNTSGRKAMSPK